MAVKNSLTTQNKKKPFSLVINSDGYKRMINNTLKDPKRTAKFVTAITSAVVTTPALAECEASTIVSGGLLGEALSLSPSPQLGQYYLVPFKDNKNGRTTAQFVIGYKGYIQLAVRSGYYKKLNVLPIKQGELIRFDPLEEEIEVQLIQNEREREQAETMGYYAMFEYQNGFRKAIYWSKEKMESHALKYSQGYRSDKKNNRAWTFWSKDFDGMACKTMIRQLISKWGIMSIDLETAIEKDNAAIGMDNSGEFTADFIDNAPEENAPTVDAATGEIVEEVQAETAQPTQDEPADFGDLLEG